MFKSAQAFATSKFMTTKVDNKGNNIYFKKRIKSRKNINLVNIHFLELFICFLYEAQIGCFEKIYCSL